MLPLLLGFIIIWFAASIQGISGFGLSLVAVPLLSLILPLEVVVPLMVVFSLILNVISFSKIKGHVNKTQMLILICCGVLFIPVGIYGLKTLDDQIIKVVAGVIISFSAIMMAFGFKLKFNNQKIAYGITGMLSGVLNGASSLSGPPVILLLSNEGGEKNNFRKTLATYFMLLNIFTLPAFVIGGFDVDQVLYYGIRLLPALIIGTLFGIAVGNKVPEALFRKLTLGLILVMGIMTVLSGV